MASRKRARSRHSRPSRRRRGNMVPGAIKIGHVDRPEGMLAWVGHGGTVYAKDPQAMRRHGDKRSPKRSSRKGSRKKRGSRGRR